MEVFPRGEPMIPEDARARAIEVTEAFLDLLDEMVEEYDAESRRSMRWVLEDRDLLDRYLRDLNALKTREDLEAFWTEARNIPRVLGCSLDDPLADRYSDLQLEMFQEIVDMVALARKGRTEQSATR